MTRNLDKNSTVNRNIGVDVPVEPGLDDVTEGHRAMRGDDDQGGAGPIDDGTSSRQRQ